MNETPSSGLGETFIADDWPHGLTCPSCQRVLQEGEQYATLLDSFSEDVPVAQVVCLSCALG